MAADRREPLRALSAMRFRMRDRRAGAAVMIVAGRKEHGAGHIRHRSVILIAQTYRPNSSNLFECSASVGDRENVTALPIFMLRRNRKRLTVRAGFCKFSRPPASSHGSSRGAPFAPSSIIIELGVIMLKGKSALVTGSTSGIGLAMARAFAGQGANITINGFGDKDAIEKERSNIEKDFGVKAIYSAADMTKPDQIADMIKTSETTFGSLDVLVNNAGIQHVAPIEEFPIDQWNLIIAINLVSAFHTIRTAVPGMKARKWGRIINTASAHSLVASPFKSAYVTAKHGLAGLTKTVALEVATFGITANCISPGYVWTPLVEKQIPDTMKARNMTAEQVKRDVLLAAQPTKEFVTVDEVADLAVYLASDAARSITGANLSIDGGWTAE